MKLSKTEINTFLKVIQVNKDLKNNSLDFLNLLIEGVAKNIPWQNISMIEKGLGNIPTFDDIKKDMLNGKGGICLDINRFMFYVLNEIGFDVQYIMCGRYNAEKRHIAIVSYFNNCPYFVDFGDAQPYYKAFKVDDNTIIKRNSFEYQFKRLHNEYHLLIKKNNEWNIQYVFNLKEYKEIDFLEIITNYYTDKFFGPFWQSVHFAYYPNKKFRAIKGTTIWYENDKNKIIKLKHATIEEFNTSLSKYFDKKILDIYQFEKNINKLKEIVL